MIDALIGRINGQVIRLLRAACGEERGWPEAVRQAGLAARPPAGGPAPAEEVRGVLDALVVEALAALDEHAATVDPVQLAGLRQRLGMLAEHETKRYAAAMERDAAVGPPPKPSLGIANIFKNAVETYQMSPWAHLEYDNRITITCRTCGAPQQTQREFHCGFCGGNMFNREEGS